MRCAAMQPAVMVMPASSYSYKIGHIAEDNGVISFKNPSEAMKASHAGNEHIASDVSRHTGLTT